MGPFQVISTAIFSIVFIYVSHQVTRFAKLQTYVSVSIVLLLGLIFLGTLVLFNHLAAPKQMESHEHQDSLVNIGMTLLAYINFIVTFVILRDIFGFLDRLFLKSRYADSLYGATGSYVMLILPVLAIMLGYLIVFAGPNHKKVEIKSAQLPEKLDGLRIVHLTDIHIGATLPSSLLQKIVEKSNALNPDIVVLTGDILDHFPEPYSEDLKTLGKLNATHGVYYVLGNHEYYWSYQSSHQAFKNLGFRVLENDVHDLEVSGHLLQIAGLTDPAAARFNQELPDLAKIAEKYKPESFKIMLAHQPFVAPQVSKIGTHVQFSGHTHGGQFFPWNYLIVFFQKYVKGLYQIDDMQLYVNQGTGYWGPSLRLGTYSEITEIFLRKE